MTDFDMRIRSAIFQEEVITVRFGKLVRHERAWSNKRVQLHERWGWAPRSRLAGAGSKPP
jgi:hypothetical protein